MIDIDKELKSIQAEYKPDEFLRQQTRSLLKREIEHKRQGKTFKKAAFVLCPAAAFVLILILCISVFTAVPAKAAGYYTIDINPSISIAVDENDVVISVDPENEDAVRLLQTIELKGIQFQEALKMILQAAEQMDFIKDNGHLLVAHFGEGPGMTQEELVSLVNTEMPDAKINALSINGSTDDFENAKKSGKKAGIELLIKNAGDAGIDGQDPDTVINIMNGKAGNDHKENNGNNTDNGKHNNGSQTNGDNSTSNPPGNGNHGGSGNNGNSGKDNNGNKDKDDDKGNTKKENTNKGKDN